MVLAITQTPPPQNIGDSPLAQPTQTRVTFRTVPMVGRNADVLAQEFQRLVEFARLGYAIVAGEARGPKSRGMRP